MSKYDYTNDAIGRRTERIQSGTAFAATDTVTVGYNDRNEVTSADAAIDTNYLYSYDFDPIGNRKTYTEGTNPATSYTSNELNQYAATANPSQTILYDDDITQCYASSPPGRGTPFGSTRPALVARNWLSFSCCTTQKRNDSAMMMR